MAFINLRLVTGLVFALIWVNDLNLTEEINCFIFNMIEFILLISFTKKQKKLFRGKIKATTCAPNKIWFSNCYKQLINRSIITNYYSNITPLYLYNSPE